MDESGTITRRVYLSQEDAKTTGFQDDERIYFELASRHAGVLVVVEDGDGKQVWAGCFDQDQLKRALGDATYDEELGT